MNKNLLFVMLALFVSTGAKATVTTIISNGVLTITKDAVDDEINTSSLSEFTGWNNVKTVIVKNADGISNGITETEVSAILGSCNSNFERLNLQNMKSCTLPTEAKSVTLSNFKYVLLPYGSTIDNTVFGGSFPFIISKATSSSTDYEYSILTNSPNGGLTSAIDASDNNITGGDNRIYNIIITGTMLQTDLDRLQGGTTYLNVSAVTGDNVNTLTYSGFSTKLYSIKLPATMTSIPASCLSGCSKIASIRIPDGVTSIGTDAFKDCSSLTAVNVPDKVVTIGNNAFYGDCIISINLPEGLTTIGANAFTECKYLHSIIIPASVTKIGIEAFYRCNTLKDIYFKGKVPDIIDKSGNTSTTGFIAAEDQMNGVTYKHTTGGETAAQVDYGSLNAEPGNGSGLVMLHVLPAYAYDNGDALGYTIKARYVKDNTQYNGTNIYYQFQSSDYDGTLRYPSEQQIKDVLSQASSYTNTWKQFALVDPTYDPYSSKIPNLKDATWYTLCYPIDMTRGMIEDIFGGGTEVCEFVGVTSSSNGTTDIRTIHFTKDLIIEGVTDKGIPNTLYSTKIIDAGHPYMIHPSSAPETVNINGTETTAYFVNKYYEGTTVSLSVDGKTVDTPYIGTQPSGTTFVPGYTFEGNYVEKTMPAKVFYLGTYNGADVYKFADTENASRKFKAYTAVIYPPSDVNNNESKMTLAFGGDTSNTPTGISEIPASGTMTIRTRYTNKVFNMQGQVVRTDCSCIEGLNKGIYIVNGKKYVVH